MNKDLKLIKNHYGEKMMHLCRELFPTLLEDEGYLSKLMLDNFATSRFLYDDIINNSMIYQFSNYINKLVEKEQQIIETNKTPQQLLSEVGYNFYECYTEEEIQSFKKYYAKNEELCTFNGGRLDICHVFFAVKKNVDEIKRDNYENPKRQDEYGTSVISIQFTKGCINTLSIKNRYNHTVDNPDATFSNNLENIIEGLTNSFEKEYNLNINQNNSKEFELEGYVKANDGKYYKYNYEMYNVYFCPNNIIIDNFKVIKYPKESYIILDYFILDLINKTIKLYCNNISDSFIDGLQNIDKINIVRDEKTETKKIEILQNDKVKAIIKINKLNQIIEYENFDIEKVKDHFLILNDAILNINLPKVEEIGYNFLVNNTSITNICLENIKQIGNYFLFNNEVLEELLMPNLEKVGYHFLSSNLKLNSVCFPNLKEAGRQLLINNQILTSIIAPKLEKVGRDFLYENQSLQKLDLPELKEISDSFLQNNEILEEISLPKVKNIGNQFLYNNKKLKTISLASTEKIGDSFLCKNEILKEINLPKVKKIGSFFLRNNKKLKKIEMLELLDVLSEFMSENQILEEINLPKIKEIGPFFLYKSENLKKLILDEATWISSSFLSNNPNIEYIYAPNLNHISFDFLTKCRSVKIYAPKIDYESPTLVDNVEDLYDHKIIFTKIINDNYLQKTKNEKLGKQKLK